MTASFPRKQRLHSYESVRLPGRFDLFFPPLFFAAQAQIHDEESNGAAPLTIAEQYLFRSVNAERAAAGLPGLTWNGALVRAARYHAEEMGNHKILSHQLSGEPDLVQRAGATDAHFSRITENVAVGPSILQMHDALMHSPHHRENILDAAVNSVAIAVISRRGELWAVEDFAQDLGTINLADQEKRVASLLARAGIPTEVTDDARSTCRQSTGYVGERPGFVMRYVTGDLDRLPEQLTVKLAQHLYASAAVGACSPSGSHGFTSYSFAVLLYR